MRWLRGSAEVGVRCEHRAADFEEQKYSAELGTVNFRLAYIRKMPQPQKERSCMVFSECVTQVMSTLISEPWAL